jgi:hypothetical protein
VPSTESLDRGVDEPIPTLSTVYKGIKEPTAGLSQGTEIADEVSGNNKAKAKSSFFILI